MMLLNTQCVIQEQRIKDKMDDIPNLLKNVTNNGIMLVHEGTNQAQISYGHWAGGDNPISAQHA